jgi:hypothetical protein
MFAVLPVTSGTDIMNDEINVQLEALRHPRAN